jgi:hypothetical protein
VVPLPDCSPPAVFRKNRALTEREAGHTFNKRQQLGWPVAEEI